MRKLLEAAGLTHINDAVLRRAECLFSSRIISALLQQNPMSARDIYFDAENMPSTTTKVVLSGSNIRLNGELFGGNSNLLLCFEKTVPHVLKFVDREEMERLTPIRNNLNHPNIVQFKFVSDKHIIMPLHPTTLEHMEYLDQDEAHLLWQNLEPALVHLHSNRLAHMDVKSSNILISCQGSFILGDLGSVAIFGNKSASTQPYVPLDMQKTPCILTASAGVDWWMLAMVFAEKVARLQLGGTKREPDRSSLKGILSKHVHMPTIWQHLKEKISATEDV